MKQNFFNMNEHKKLDRLPLTDPWYLVPELQSFEDTKIKAKTADTKQGN